MLSQRLSLEADMPVQVINGQAQHYQLIYEADW